MILRPDSNEYPEFYQGYIQMVPETDILVYLNDQIRKVGSLNSEWKDKNPDYRYAEGKWSVKEIVGHISDTERVFAYRAMCISRNELASLPGFNQDDYVSNSNFEAVPFGDLIDEFVLLRKSNLQMFYNFSNSAWKNTGIANGKEISIRAILYIIAGHLEHHLDIIRERYK